MTVTHYAGSDMTEEEKELLHKWIKAGHDPHDNPWCMAGEDGRTLDFITARRDMLDLKDQCEVGS